MSERAQDLGKLIHRSPDVFVGLGKRESAVTDFREAAESGEVFLERVSKLDLTRTPK